MASPIERKTLDQLVQTFSEAAEQTGQLDTVISNFADVAEAFQRTLMDVDEKIRAKDMTDLADEAIEKLQNVTLYNDQKTLDLLDTIVENQLAAHTVEITTQLAARNAENMANIENQLAAISRSMQTADQQEKLMALLQKLDQQTAPAPVHSAADSSELAKFEGIIQQLNEKIKEADERITRIEKSYEEKVQRLESEIVLLRAQKQTEQWKPIEISDDDLPWKS